MQPDRIGQPNSPDHLPADGMDTPPTELLSAPPPSAPLALDALKQLAQLSRATALYRGSNGAGPELSVGQQANRLIMHARNVGRRPESERPKAFNDVLAAISHLPSQGRAHLLECLVRQIDALPVEARSAAFRSIANALDRLSPEQRVGPLSVLASQVCKLPRDGQLGAIDFVIGQAALLSGEHASSVLSALARDFSGSRRATAELFERVHAAAARLPADHRANPIDALVKQFTRLSPTRREREFARLIDLSAGMSEEAAAATLASIGTRFRGLPLDSRSAAFSRLLQEISQLPLDVRTRSLRRLALCVEDIPEMEQASALHAIADLANGLSEPLHELTYLLWPSKLVLGDEVRLELFERILNAAALLSRDAMRWPLRGLSEAIRYLPLEARSAAFHQVLSQVPQLPAEDAADVLHFHVFPIFKLPEDDRLPAMHALIDCLVDRLPYEQHLEHRSRIQTTLEMLVAALPLKARNEGYGLLQRFRDRRA